MPGLRVTSVNPAYADAGSFAMPNGADAMARLNIAQKQGIISYDEILDGLTIKPAERKKKMLELENAAEDEKWKKENKGGINVVRANTLRQGILDSEFSSKESAARNSAYDANPAMYDDFAKRKLSITDAGLQADQSRLNDIIAKQKLMENDPLGLKAERLKVIADAGHPVNYDWTGEEVLAKFKPAYKELQQRLQDSLIFKARLEGVSKGVESKDKVVAEMRDRFFKNKVVDQHSKMVESADRIKALASEKHPTPSSDQALIFAYMKLLDPDSAVLPGERATIENARGVPEKIWDLWNETIKSGGKYYVLNERQRKEILSASKIQMKAHVESLDKTTHAHRRRAEALGVDPELVVAGGIVEGSATPTAKAALYSAATDVTGKGVPEPLATEGSKYDPAVAPGVKILFVPSTGKRHYAKWVNGAWKWLGDVVDPAVPVPVPTNQDFTPGTTADFAAP